MKDLSFVFLVVGFDQAEWRGVRISETIEYDFRGGFQCEA